MIEFLCPNGHRIHCPEEQAGRAAKCPRCGVKFRIPSQSEAKVAGPSEGGSGVSRPELNDSGSSGIRGSRAVADQQPEIEFLCPNGHRLHGAASLQGRPGQCPECGSRFRIPTYEDVPEEEGTEQGIGVSRADSGGRSGTALAEVEETGQTALRLPTDHAPAIEPRFPLAELFARLWAERPPGTVVELHLAGGETLRPDRFAPALSRYGHGVFAVKDPEGTHTLVVVAWDTIVRVLVRGLGELPWETSE
jgi:DNA-directed RNA polymerase subunit RPC12/RpoP